MRAGDLNKTGLQAVENAPVLRPNTRDWQPAFLATLALTANVRLSCQQAGVSRAMAYHARIRSAKFAAQWRDAMDEAIDILQAEARRRAMTVSDLLLIFLLKAHRPEMYRETIRQEITGEGGGPIEIAASMVEARLKRIIDAEFLPTPTQESENGRQPD